MRQRLLLAALVIGVGVLVAGSSTEAAVSRSRSASVVISTRVVQGLGTVLVDGRGRTLYMFVRDKRKRVSCVGACAAIWPPVKLAKGAKAVATGKARASLLGSDPNPAGGRVVTYDGWPLYAYVTDTRPGQAKGQALNLNGGLWYVLAPSGTIIKTKLSTTKTSAIAFTGSYSGQATTLVNGSTVTITAKGTGSGTSIGSGGISAHGTGDSSQQPCVPFGGTGTITGAGGTIDFKANPGGTGCGDQGGHNFTVKVYLAITSATGKLANAKGTLRCVGTYSRDSGDFQIKLAGNLTR